MTSNLNALTNLMAPPGSPTHAEKNTLRMNERILGIKFPDDYVEFSRIYGSGRISVGKYWWEIIGAFDEKLPHFILAFISTRGGFRSQWSDVQPPIGLFPEKKGMLPFGYMDCDYFGWIVEGDPNTWKVVLNWSWTDDGYAIYDTGFTEFWLSVLTLQREIPGYECDWDSKKDVSFEQVPFSI